MLLVAGTSATAQRIPRACIAYERDAERAVQDAPDSGRRYLSTTLFDRSGRRIEEAGRSEDDLHQQHIRWYWRSQWQLDSITITHDHDLHERHVYRWSEDDCSSVTEQYDAKGELQETLRRRYDDSTRIIEEEASWPADSSRSYWRYQYDTAGVQITVMYTSEEHVAGSGWVTRDTIRTQPHFDSLGRVVLLETVSAHNRRSSKSYTYDPAGRLARESSFWNADSMISTYEYDPSGHVIGARWSISTDPSGRPHNSESHAIYDAEGRMVSLESCQGYSSADRDHCSTAENEWMYY